MAEKRARARKVKRQAPPPTVREILERPRFLDFVLDELTEAKGLQRGTDALGLARWDLSAAIKKGLAREEARRV